MAPGRAAAVACWRWARVARESDGLSFRTLLELRDTLHTAEFAMEQSLDQTQEFWEVLEKARECVEVYEAALRLADTEDVLEFRVKLNRHSGCFEFEDPRRA